MEKEKVKEKVGKKSGAPAAPPKKEAAKPKGYLPTIEELESIAKTLKLVIKKSDSRTTLWTSNSVRVLKIAGNSLSVTFPKEAALHVNSKKELVELLKTVAEEASKAPARVPPKRKPAEKKSTEQKVKEKVASSKPAEKKPAPKPAKKMLIKPDGVKPKKKVK